MDGIRVTHEQLPRSIIEIQKKFPALKTYT